MQCLQHFYLFMCEIGKKEKCRLKKQQTGSDIHCTQYINPVFTYVRRFNLLRITVAKKSVTKLKLSVEIGQKEKNKEIKGQISISSLIPVYTIHQPTVQVYTKRKPLGLTVLREKKKQKIFFQCLKVGVKEKKMKIQRNNSLIPADTRY